MLRDNKGITIIALIVTLLVLIIIMAIGVRAGRESIKASKDNRLLTELDMVQHAVFERYTKYKLVNDSSLLVGTKITYSQAKETADEMQCTIPDDITYYNLSVSNLKELGLEVSDYEYIVNYENGIVMNKTTSTTSSGTALYKDTGKINTTN